MRGEEGGEDIGETAAFAVLAKGVERRGEDEGAAHFKSCKAAGTLSVVPAGKEGTT